MLEKNANTRINDFTDLIEIGKGGFGVVYSAKRLNGEPVALKKIDRSVPRDRVWNEVRSLKRLRHRKIVEFYEDFEVNGETYVVMELCEYGSVRSYVKKHGPLPDAVAAHVLRQMMSAVTYMHRREVLHRDLSAGNILIKSIKDGFLNVKLGDFGLATNLRRGETACTVVGTPGYIAPQVFNQDYDETADVYSLGGVLYTMLTAGDPPRNGRLNFDGLSHSAVALIKKMMHPDVHSRISLNAISTMDFMRDLDEGGYSRDVSTERRGFSRDRRTSVERTRRSRDAQLERNNNWDQNWQPAKPPTRSASQPPVLSRRSSNNAERPNGVPSRPSPLDPRAKPVDEDLPPWPLKFARCAGNRVKTKGGRYIVENDFRVRFEVAQKGDLIARVIIAEINSRGDQQRLLVHNTLSRNEPAREENDPLIELDRAPKVFTSLAQLPQAVSHDYKRMANMISSTIQSRVAKIVFRRPPQFPNAVAQLMENGDLRIKLSNAVIVRNVKSGEVVNILDGQASRKEPVTGPTLRKVGEVYEYLYRLEQCLSGMGDLKCFPHVFSVLTPEAALQATPVSVAPTASATSRGSLQRRPFNAVNSSSQSSFMPRSAPGAFERQFSTATVASAAEQADENAVPFKFKLDKNNRTIAIIWNDGRKLRQSTMNEREFIFSDAVRRKEIRFNTARDNIPDTARQLLDVLTPELSPLV